MCRVRLSSSPAWGHDRWRSPVNWSRPSSQSPVRPKVRCGCLIPAARPLPGQRKGQRVALIYALVAERLTAYYEHGQWLTESQGASLAAEWLARHSVRWSSPSGAACLR